MKAFRSCSIRFGAGVTCSLVCGDREPVTDAVIAIVNDLVRMHVLFYKRCEGRNSAAHLLNKFILAEGLTYFQHVNDHVSTKVITFPVNFGVTVSKYRCFDYAQLITIKGKIVVKRGKI
ncbi:hypothetical protein Tco_0985234 [Tanacetum coccineum]